NTRLPAVASVPPAPPANGMRQRSCCFTGSHAKKKRPATSGCVAAYSVSGIWPGERKSTPVLVLPGVNLKSSGLVGEYVAAASLIGIYTRPVVGLKAIGCQLREPAAPGQILIVEFEV